MEHRFTLKDYAGTAHGYTMTRHPGSEGTPLCQQLLGLIVEPLAVGAGPLVSVAMANGGVKGITPEILAALDFGALSRAARSSLLSLPMPTTMAILRYVNRDGKPLVGNDGRPTAAYDEAYAGNYAEVGQAVWEACSHNRFFPGLDTFAGVAKQALAAMRETPANAG